MEVTARTDGRLWSVVAFTSVRNRVKKSDINTVRSGTGTGTEQFFLERQERVPIF